MGLLVLTYVSYVALVLAPALSLGIVLLRPASRRKEAREEKETDVATRFSYCDKARS
jgi:hypothetical protein